MERHMSLRPQVFLKAINKLQGQYGLNMAFSPHIAPQICNCPVSAFQVSCLFRISHFVLRIFPGGFRQQSLLL